MTSRTRIAAVLSAGTLAATIGLAACSDGQQDAGSTADSPSDGGGGSWSVTDVADRTVELDHAPERVMLAESRTAFVTSFLNKEKPLDKIVAWGTDLQTAAPDFYEPFAEAAPEAEDLPEMGGFKKGDITVESILEQDPDIIVMTLEQRDAAEEAGLLKMMDDAGLKYVFTDFRYDPVENTTKSVEVIGKVLGAEDAAGDYVEFYNDRLDHIKDVVAKQDDRPKSFLWRAAGLIDCCGTFGDENLGQMISTAGGGNIGESLLEGKESGDVTAEKVISEEPEVMIATGGDWSVWQEKHKEETDGPVLFTHMGYGHDADEAQESLKKVLDSTKGFELLKAPEEGGLHAVYHQFYDSPFNIFAIEAFAKWIHPEAFGDLDPAEDFKEFHSEHMPFDADGTFFLTYDAD